MMLIAPIHYLLLSACLFVLGCLGLLLHRRNIIGMLMSLELMLLAANLNFVAFGAVHGSLGSIFALFTLTLAGAEAAIGLAIVVLSLTQQKETTP
jgi:NADH-quinone oxidoreductase subunit K